MAALCHAPEIAMPPVKVEHRFARPVHAASAGGPGWRIRFDAP